MEYYAHSTFPVEASSDPRQEWQHAVASSRGGTGLEEAVWHLNLQSSDEMEEAQGIYPERPGEPDCVYYMRTGLCSFGISCRYNHPPNWKLAAAIARNKGEYPERPGQPECQYFLKTGTCKFGSTCKYHHPRDKAGLAGRVQLNMVGYPLRPGEKECAYYLRTGACKYGVTCKYHHPQPQNVMPGSPVYGASSNSAAGAPQPYPWPVRSPYLQSPRLNSAGYTPVMLPSPQGIVSMSPGWTTYQGPVSPLASPEGAQHLGLIYSPRADPGFNPMGPLQASPLKDAVFPERPGVPDCQYYLKTGDCKFGVACRYHHPKDKPVGFTLSAQGLPLRPGAPQCTYYARNGLCKFGTACRYDHSSAGGAAGGGLIGYSPSTSSLADMPVAPYPPTPAQVSVEVNRGVATQHSSSASEELGRNGSEDLSNVQSSIIPVDYSTIIPGF